MCPKSVATRRWQAVGRGVGGGELPSESARCFRIKPGSLTRHICCRMHSKTITNTLHVDYTNDRRMGARQCDEMVIALTFRDQYYRRYRVTDRVYRVQRQSRHSIQLTETFDSPNLLIPMIVIQIHWWRFIWISRIKDGR